MQLQEALEYLKVKGLDSDKEFMLGLMYEGDLFTLVKLTYEDDGEGDWCVAHLISGHLTSSSLEQGFYSGENTKEILREARASLNKEELNKFKGINYKIYALDKDVMDSMLEYALCALFPDLPDALISDYAIPSKNDIAKFKIMAKEKIDRVNSNKHQ